MLEKVILLSLVVSFILAVYYKLNINEKMQQIDNKIIRELATCTFCLSFWLSLVICVMLAVVCKEITYIIYPFLISPIVRMML